MSKMKWFVVAGVGLFLVSAVAFGAYYHKSSLKVRRWLTVGTTTPTGEITSKTDGTEDMYSGVTSGDVESFKVDKDGDLTAVGGVFSGALILPQKTADACTETGYTEGSVFWNSTSNYPCFCGGNDGTTDLKFNDNSTACF